MGSVEDHVQEYISGPGSVRDKLHAFFGRGVLHATPVASPPDDSLFDEIPEDGALVEYNDHLYLRTGTNVWTDIGPGAGGGGGGAPVGATYLVTAAHAELSAEVVVGANPGGELGGTWAAPTVDAVHSGSAHHAEAHAINGAGHTGTLDDAQIPAAIARDTEVATAVSDHAALADPHAGYQKESEKGAVNGYASLDGSGTIPDAQIPAAIARDSELHAQNHSDTQHTDGPNSKPGHQHSHDSDLTGVSADDHHAQSHTHASHTGVGADDHHAQSHSHASHTGVGADDHHAQSHAISSHTGFIISRGGTVIKSDGVAAINVIVWRAPYACTVTNVRGYRVGGTGATINARRNNTDNHLSSALSLTSADQWMDGGAVQNTAYAAGDEMEIMVVSTAGSPTQVAIQIDLTRP